MSTINDREVNAAPTYGTAAFDKRMELDGGSSRARNGIDTVRRKQRWDVNTAKEATRRLSSSPKQRKERRRVAPVVAKVEEGEEGEEAMKGDALDVDVLRQLRSLRSAEKKKKKTKKKTTTRGGGGAGRGPGGGTPKKNGSSGGKNRLTPSPPKKVAGRISEVPHSDVAAVRRWERRPFS